MIVLLFVLASTGVNCFQPGVSSLHIKTLAQSNSLSVSCPASKRVATKLRMALDRRAFLDTATAALIAGELSVTQPANAQVFLDPAMYGDQELRVGAVDSLKESVRRAILQNPELAPSFYQLAVLDGLSYNAATNEFGPDGSVMKSVLLSKESDAYTKNLQSAALALVNAENTLKMKTAITIADAVAIGGAEAIESIGGPSLVVQLGRTDASRSAPLPTLPIDLLSGTRSNAEVQNAFRSAGLTEREMTAILGALMTLETVQKTRSTEDWREAARPKFREPGKMGRMSEFKRLTDEDIAQAELEEDPDYQDPDDGWYIADSFGTRESRFGERLAKEDINEKTFNRYLKEISEEMKPKKGPAITPADASRRYGWIAGLLLDPSIPTCQTWLSKYGASNLNYIKDLGTSIYSLTQLGGVYTGGKYESLLKNKPRKSLNDDEMNLGF
jgi:Peroxidase